MQQIKAEITRSGTQGRRPRSITGGYKWTPEEERKHLIRIPLDAKHPDGKPVTNRERLNDLEHHGVRVDRTTISHRLNKLRRQLTP